LDRVGTTEPVYLPLDIDTLDPACKWKRAKEQQENSNITTQVSTATGTPETGGWSTRELRTIIRGLEGINLVAADIVEVAPAYDTDAEHTIMAAADALYEIMSLMVKMGPLSEMVKEQIEELKWT